MIGAAHLSSMKLEEIILKNLKPRLSVRQKIFCGLFGFIVAFLYYALVFAMLKVLFQHWSTYDHPTAKSEFLRIFFSVIFLPFSAIPVLNQYAFLLDIIMWWVIGGAVYALFCPRKIIALAPIDVSSARSSA
jgi:hypothetical protein